MPKGVFFRPFDLILAYFVSVAIVCDLRTFYKVSLFAK